MAWHPTWNEPPERRSGCLLGGGATPPGVTLILLATIAVFVLDGLTRGSLTEIGALTVRSLMYLEVWRLVTYQFLHAGLGHIFWNMFVLWMIGITLERQLGTRQFLWLYFLSGVAGGLFEVAFNVAMQYQFGPAFFHMTGGKTFLDMPAVGASAGVSGVLVAFAVINPRAKFLLFFFIPIEAKWLAIGFLVITSIGVWQELFFGRVEMVAHAAHLGGMVFGYVWVKWGLGIAGWWRHGARRPGERFIERPRDEEQAETDRLLDKIRNEGLDSLTPEERMFLQEMSRKYRD